jgi:3-hydroxybutyrate dehydrogenase
MSRVALVTGAAGGIGAAIVTRLEADGWDVHGVDVTDADLTTREGNRAVVDAALERYGRLDAVVANAGFQHVAPIAEFPADTFARILRIMVEAPFRLVRAALPGMYQRGWGRVINISSVHGLIASPYKVAYVTAKHALEGLSKVIALEGGGRGVTSNTICPAYVRTPLVEKQIADQARIHGISEDRVVEEIMLTEPSIKRLIEPAEVAELVAYLCSAPAAFANGSSYLLDGGWSAR